MSDCVGEDEFCAEGKRIKIPCKKLSTQKHPLCWIMLQMEAVAITQTIMMAFLSPLLCTLGKTSSVSQDIKGGFSVFTIAWGLFQKKNTLP